MCADEISTGGADSAAADVVETRQRTEAVGGAESPATRGATL